jgi:simple sugar transport system substrate-binding protein
MGCETIDSEKYAQANIDELAKDMGGKGGYVIYVGSLTVPGFEGQWNENVR